DLERLEQGIEAVGALTVLGALSVASRLHPVRSSRGVGFDLRGRRSRGKQGRRQHGGDGERRESEAHSTSLCSRGSAASPKNAHRRVNLQPKRAVSRGKKAAKTTKMTARHPVQATQARRISLGEP